MRDSGEDIIRKGRAGSALLPSRLQKVVREADPAFVDDVTAEPETLATEVRPDRSRSILSRNDSPDIGFELSINPYRGCEHGCIYCYARPGHGYLDHRPGLDFERIVYAKHDAANLLRAAFTGSGYVPKPIALGAVTDIYQPLEGRLGVTRAVLEVLVECRHPVRLVTKSNRILRDMDLLKALAVDDLVEVDISLTTLDRDLARKMEPRACAPHRRLQAIQELAATGVPVGVSTSPVIPGLTDHELESLLKTAAEAGASWSNCILVRLPHEVAPLFEAWLRQHYPDRADKVLSQIRTLRGGKLNDPRFHHRMRGEGPLAELIRARFQKASRRYGLTRRPTAALRTDLFRPPRPAAADRQFELFTER